MNSLWYDLLLRSFDSTLTPTEQQQLDHALLESHDIQMARKEILRMRNALSSSAELSFTPGFAGQVMRRIAARQQSAVYRFETVFRPIAVAALLLVALICTYNAARANTLTVDSLLGIQKPTLEQTLGLEATLE
jgi:hypothetical protein